MVIIHDAIDCFVATSPRNDTGLRHFDQAPKLMNELTLNRKIFSDLGAWEAISLFLNCHPELVSGSHSKLLMFQTRDAETSSAWHFVTF